MGATVSNLMKDLNTDSSEEVKHELQIYSEMGEAIIEAKSKEMETNAFGNKNLPVVAIVESIYDMHVVANSGVGEEVTKAVDSCFKNDLVSGLKSTITTGLTAFLGKATAGKQEKRDFYVIFSHNAMLRVEVFFYKHDFSSKALKDHGQSMLCYVAQTCVLDCVKTDPQVILYEVSRSIGANVEEALETLKKDAEFVQQFMEVLIKLNEAQKKTEIAK